MASPDFFGGLFSGSDFGSSVSTPPLIAAPTAGDTADLNSVPDSTVSGVSTGDNGGFLTGLTDVISSLGTGFSKAYGAFNTPSPQKVAGTGPSSNSTPTTQGLGNIAATPVGTLLNNPLSALILIGGAAWWLSRRGR